MMRARASRRTALGTFMSPVRWAAWGTRQQRANCKPDGAFRISSSGGADGFISQFDSTLTVERAGSFGGAADETLTDMALDDSGNILATGRYQGTVDFDPTSGV